MEGSSFLYLMRFFLVVSELSDDDKGVEDELIDVVEELGDPPPPPGDPPPRRLRRSFSD